jgi:hypothetical protein
MDSSTTPICKKEGCTLSDTGICILSKDPATCPERLASLWETDSNVSGDEVLSTPKEPERFAGSFTLGTSQVEKLMQQRYCHVVGILGPPGAGKTACLVSFYLLLANARLQGFEFRDSKSLMAFEEISRGAKRWNAANYPDQLTVHTEIADERDAGFLHVRLKASALEKSIDFLMSDLPGEWSNSLIDSNRADRLSFLKSADRIWIMINGEEIANDTTRNYTIHRLSILIDRVAALLGEIRPPITLVVTRKDRFESKEVYYEKLKEKANESDFSFKVIEIASFSDGETVAAGDGIDTLITDLISIREIKATAFWPQTKNQFGTRQMMKFGKV